MDKNELARLEDVIDRSKPLMQMMTRGADSIQEFQSLDHQALEKIANFMPEIYRANNSLGKKNTQVTSKLMTMTMIASGPYRWLRQCLAEIEKRRGALKENMFKLAEERLDVEKMMKLKTIMPVKDDIEARRLDIQISKKVSDINDSLIYIEGCMKEIGNFQQVYRDVMETHNIPEDWGEEELEKDEIAHHIRTAFNHGYRDLIVNGHIGMGTIEYFEQYGILPEDALIEIQAFIETEEKTIQSMYDWQDAMVEKYFDNHVYPMHRIGIRSIMNKDYLFGGGK